MTQWNESHEILLQQWADMANSYAYLHEDSHRRCRTRNYMFALPIIVLSSIAGSANFASAKIGWAYTNEVLGIISVLTATIATVQSYLKVAERSEAHRISFLGFSKLARNIQTELGFPPEERPTEGPQFVAAVRSELDRLFEVSPEITAESYNLFNKTFSKKPSVYNPDDIYPCTIYCPKFVSRGTSPMDEEEEKSSM